MMNSSESRPVLIDGVSYPAVLTDVEIAFNPEKDVYVLRFHFRIYANYSHAEEVEKDFYLYDNNSYRRRTVERLSEYFDLYALKLMNEEYYDNARLLNACRWLVGTKIEIKQRNYKDEKRYTLITTERANYSRVNGLWDAMLKDNLEIYPGYRQNSLPVLEEQAWYKY